MQDTDSSRLREIEVELRAIAKHAFTTMYEYIVSFGFSDRGASYQTVIEAGSRRQAELSFRCRYFRETNLRVHSVAKSSKHGWPYNPYVLAVQSGVISREEHARRAHDPDDPVEDEARWTEPDGTPVRVRARRQEDEATASGMSGRGGREEHGGKTNGKPPVRDPQRRRMHPHTRPGGRATRTRRDAPQRIRRLPRG